MQKRHCIYQTKCIPLSPVLDGLLKHKQAVKEAKLCKFLLVFSGTHQTNKQKTPAFLKNNFFIKQKYSVSVLNTVKGKVSIVKKKII